MDFGIVRFQLRQPLVTCRRLFEAPQFKLDVPARRIDLRRFTALPVAVRAFERPQRGFPFPSQVQRHSLRQPVQRRCRVLWTLSVHKEFSFRYAALTGVIFLLHVALSKRIDVRLRFLHSDPYLTLPRTLGFAPSSSEDALAGGFLP